MNESERLKFREAILKGMNMAFERLVEERMKEGESLVLLRNGKIEHVPASEIYMQKKGGDQPHL